MMDVIFVITILGVTMLLSFFGDMIFKKTEIPNVIWLLIFGLILGPILNLIDGNMLLGISEYFATIAIIIILFDGGINLDFDQFIKEIPRASLLTIVSFITSTIMVTIIMVILGNSIINGILLGAILGGTSSIIIMQIGDKIKKLKERSKTILMLESVLNDPIGIIVAIAIIYIITTGGGIETGLQSIIQVFSIGIVIGIASGFLWLPIMNKLKSEEFSYVLTLGAAFLLYSGTSMVIGTDIGQGAGVLAILLFGIILGNGKRIIKIFNKKSEGIEIDTATRNFHSLITFFIRTFFFVYLGVVVSFKNIDFLIVGVVLGIALFAIRPLAVIISTWKADFEKDERRIMSLLIPRDLTAAVLSYIVVSYSLPNTNGFADITFGVILTTTVIATIGIAIMAHIEKINEGIKILKEKTRKKR